MQDAGGIDEKYKQTNKLLMDLRLQFEQLETAGENASLALQETVQLNLSSLSRLLDSLEREHLPSQPSKRKEIWRIRIQQIAEEYKDMRTSLGSALQKRRSREQEEEQRRQLLEGRTGRRQVASVAIDALYQESQTLDRSTRAADQIYEMGGSILSSLGQQNDLMKSAQKRLLDVGNTLGLSRSVMRMIENRQNMDKLLVYGGMVFTLIFLFALLYFFKW